MRCRNASFVSHVFVCVVAVIVLGDHAVARAATCPIDRSVMAAPVHGSLVSSFSDQRCVRCRMRRGIKVEVANTSAIAATADGEVVFAGQVAGSRWVVQRLAVRTESDEEILVTYGGFEHEALQVRAGDRVTRGAPLGMTGGRVHLGIRVNGRYVDPFPCWGGRRPRLSLRAHVALAEPPR